MSDGFDGANVTMAQAWAQRVAKRDPQRGRYAYAQIAHLLCMGQEPKPREFGLTPGEAQSLNRTALRRLNGERP